VEYSHRLLDNDEHVVAVTVGPGYYESEPSMARRHNEFANRYAAKTCLGEYAFVHDPNVDERMQQAWWKRTKNYVFVCKQSR